MIDAKKFIKDSTLDTADTSILVPAKTTIQYILHSKTAMLCICILSFLILCAIIIPLISPFNYYSQNVAFASQPPLSIDPINNSIHWFGTDHFGRDIFVRVFQGARISFTVAGAVVLIDGVIGVLYGGIAGLLGGKMDSLMMRIIDVISGIPYLIIVLLLMSVFPKGLTTIIIAYSITGWTSMARMVRGQVMTLKQREYILVAKAMGADTLYLIRHHIFPNILDLVIVSMTLDIPNIIFTEAFLSLLGLGIAPPTPSWGILLSQGIQSFQVHPTQLLIPATCVIITTLSLNVLGERLSEAYDPKRRR